MLCWDVRSGVETDMRVVGGWIAEGQTKGGDGGTVVLGGQSQVVPVGTDARLVSPASAKVTPRLGA